MDTVSIIKGLLNEDNCLAYTRAFTQVYRKGCDYSKIFIANIKSPEFYLPIGIESADRIILREADTIVIPYIPSLVNRLQIKTAATGITNAFIKCRNWHRHNRLAVISITSTGNPIIKVGQGIIIDEQSQVLLMMVDKYTYNEATRKYNIVGCEVRLHPSVFTQDTSVNRYIIKTMLPILLSNNRQLSQLNTGIFESSCYSVPVTAKIDYTVGDLLISPEKPSISYNNSDPYVLLEDTNYDY